jgi:signal transduction histidine kinase
VHDSVLQTLALIQRTRRSRAASRRSPPAGARAARLAVRRPAARRRAASLVAALSARGRDVEELHGVRIELASAGDCPVDDAAARSCSPRARR